MRRYRCRACRHPQRDAIDAALLLGAMGKRKIAAQFGIHEEQIRRHARHLRAGTSETTEPATAAPSSPRRAVLRVTYELEFLD